jgi:hypothetical protein
MQTISGAISSIQRSELVDHVSPRMKTALAHTGLMTPSVMHELGPTTFMSASTAVSVVKHRDPFQLICLFDTNILKFYWVDSLPSPRWLCDERCEQSGAYVANGRSDGWTRPNILSFSPSFGVKTTGTPFPSSKKNLNGVPVANHPCIWHRLRWD